MAMEDLSSLFSYQESVDELKQKLLYMTYELQSAKMQANEEARKNKESMEKMKHLLHLLQVAHNERDQVKNQLNKLLLENIDSASVSPPRVSPETPLFNNHHQGRTSSGVTESNSGESLYDVISPVINVTDPDSHAIYDLARGKTLPQKGKLLQAVMEAGPLLQTLMVAGSLPRWRNPPPARPLQVPPVGIKNECGPHFLKNEYAKLSCGSSELFTNSVMNFSAGGGFGTSAGVTGLASPAGVRFGSQMMIPTPKRQRIV